MLRYFIGCTSRRLVAVQRCCRYRTLAVIACVLLSGWIALFNGGLELRDLPAVLSVSSRRQRASQRFSDSCPAGGNVTCIGFATQAFGSFGYWEQVLGPGAVPACSAGCRLVADPSQAHALMFHAFDLPSRRRLRQMRRSWPAEQVWIFYSLESPVHLVTNRCVRDCSFGGWPLVGDVLAYAKESVFPSYLLRSYPPDTTEEAGYFNWTVTYRRDSTVYAPYARFSRLGNGSASGSGRTSLPPLPPTVWASAKRHLSFIVVSNCNPFNRRQEILAELSRHMELHIFGACGDRRFPPSVDIGELSKSYHFHLSFENAFCRDYITEKFYSNGLSGHAVPVVFGGLSRSDFEAVAPPNSFLYAGDFESAAALAARLKQLAGSPKEYEAMHEWRRAWGPMDAGSNRQLNVFCQLCDRLRQSAGSKAVTLDLNKFYSSGVQCRPKDFDPFTGGRA